MKKLLVLASALILSMLSTNSFAQNWCEDQVTVKFAPRTGVTMQMTIVDQEAIEQFRSKFPYDDCYQGVCAYYQDRETGHLVINFTQKRPSGHWARGSAAEYVTFWTDNGTWISINNEEKGASWLWRGCY